ncbi:glycerol-3-phosphate acyltransferase [Calidithermus timidus]|jgi:glycerol-3-phosphate acyltransferase PlsY|uniref:glycerol-3-phosphate acyltransferase n=1 Tax=Calidithermus timidus TaxID=307124 RepID=UPI000381C08C|nr:glycerol-3-phosphate acyltransferase [Calidithermus timidus]
MDALLVGLAYLIGSVPFGIVAGKLRGVDLTQRDVPGASGTFRQLGPAWGLAVALLDILKGMLVAYLSTFAHAPWALPLMATALVTGHNWPLYFGFRGGGGIAPTVGFFLWLLPQLTLTSVALGLGVAALYWQLYWKRARRGVYPIPAGAVVGYLYALFALWGKPQAFWALLLVSAVVALRGVRMSQGKW